MVYLTKIQLVYRMYHFERNFGKTHKVVWLFAVVELIDNKCDIEPKRATQFLHLVPLFLINEVGTKALIRLQFRAIGTVRPIRNWEQ